MNNLEFSLVIGFIFEIENLSVGIRYNHGVNSVFEDNSEGDAFSRVLQFSASIAL